MEAKLIKTEVNYLLENEEGVIIASTSLKNLGLSLSLKNCEVIELGYDLDELDLDKLACDWHKNEYGFIPQLQVIKAYIAGFQKALSILGDKKFSEEQLRTAYNVGYTDGKDGATFYNRFIKSLQQTEWDVWLVMACGLPDGCTEPEVSCTCDIIPSLDADGCLILKRK